MTSANPASVLPLGGGNPQIVTVVGANLDRVTGARVERNGAPLGAVTATLCATTDPSRRHVILRASDGAGPPWDVPLALALENGSPSLSVPVQLSAESPPRVMPLTALVADAIDGTLGVTQLFMNSCGGSSEARRLSLTISMGGYSTTQPMARLEKTVNASQVLEFWEDHTLDPSDFITGDITHLMKDGHPSPVSHTVTRVRMCMMPYTMDGAWKVSELATSNGAPVAVIPVELAADVRFRGRGIPARFDPRAAQVIPIEGMSVGILWGNPLTDVEMPDIIHAKPRFEVRLPLELSNGKLSYARLGSRASRRAPGGAFGEIPRSGPIPARPPAVRRGSDDAGRGGDPEGHPVGERPEQDRSGFGRRAPGQRRRPCNRAAPRQRRLVDDRARVIPAARARRDRPCSTPPSRRNSRWSVAARARRCPAHASSLGWTSRQGYPGTTGIEKVPWNLIRMTPA